MKLIIKNKRILMTNIFICLLIAISSASFINGQSSNYDSEDIRDGYSIDDIRLLLQENNAFNTEFTNMRLHNEDSSVETIPIPIPDIQRDKENHLDLQPLSSPFYVRPIVTSVDPNKRIVLTIMGCGFTASSNEFLCQIGRLPNPRAGTFLYHARSSVNYMLNFYPFNLFSEFFTVYAIEGIYQNNPQFVVRVTISVICVHHVFTSVEPGDHNWHFLICDCGFEIRLSGWFSMKNEEDYILKSYY